MKEIQLDFFKKSGVLISPLPVTENMFVAAY